MPFSLYSILSNLHLLSDLISEFASAFARKLFNNYPLKTYCIFFKVLW